jgi:hypothetical protein
MVRSRCLLLGLLAASQIACGGGKPPLSQPFVPLPADTGPGAATTPVPFENAGGMWTPDLMKVHAPKLKELGLTVDPNQLARPTGFPLGAVVSLGFCSASFVSPDGLIITNHHCVVSTLQFNSTPKDNLLKTGFYAKTRAEERFAGPSQRVFVTQAFRDVTAEVRASLEEVQDDAARKKKIEQRTKDLVAACEKGRAGIRCDAVSYYGGAQYLLIEKLEIKDVRLVFAPHESVGSFGGEVDNWRWPRHSGDFAIYRAYVGKDGKPADHAEDNVPYKPPHHLKLATKPLSAGDLVLAAGYPGTTHRLRTAAEVSEIVTWTYPRRIEFYEENIALIEKLSAIDPELALKATPQRRGMNNALTKTRGMMEGLVKGGLLAKKESMEAELRAWALADPGRKAAFGEVFDRMAKVFADQKAMREHAAFLEETLRVARLLDAAVTIVRMAEERAKPDAEREPAFQQRNWQRLEQEQVTLQRRYDRRLDAAMLKLSLERGARRPKADRSPVVAAIMGRTEPTPASIDQALDKLYRGTKLEDQATRIKLLKQATVADLKRDKDPLIRLAFTVRAIVKAKEDREDAIEGALAMLRPRYTQAMRAFGSRPIAPDANGTLRVTFGTVKGYRPKPEAPVYRPLSTVSELAAKQTGKEPFNAPEPLLEAIRSKRFGPYVARDLGEVPVDFLADLDITGGNSGSATLNARGELVGLVFDHNYESTASDWLYMPDLARSIHVDIRYVLWLLDAVYGADTVLRELGVTPAFAGATSRGSTSRSTPR